MVKRSLGEIAGHKMELSTKDAEFVRHLPQRALEQALRAIRRSTEQSHQPIRAARAIVFAEPEDDDWRELVIELVVDADWSETWSLWEDVAGAVGGVIKKLPPEEGAHFDARFAVHVMRAGNMPSGDRAATFDPRGFLELARRLLDGDSEAELRTAISRAYYSIFLRARELMASQGAVPITGRAGDHQTVGRWLRARDRVGAYSLDWLRRQRGAADYDLGTLINEFQAQEAVRQAESLWAPL